MCLLFEKLLSISAVSRQYGVPRQTLAAWKNSFSGSNIEAKRICFSHHTGPPELLPHWMLSYFRNHESADIHKGAALGMVYLHEAFGAALY
jgi:transposase-like protein